MVRVFRANVYNPHLPQLWSESGVEVKKLWGESGVKVGWGWSEGLVYALCASIKSKS